MSDKYLVTGATGFVGSCLVRRLVAKGKNVHILTRNKKCNWRLSDIYSKIKIHQVDLLDKKLNSVIKNTKPDFIFHLAAYGSLPKEENIDYLIDVNLRGTINLINALKQNKFKLFINTGSSSEYGIKTKAMNEHDTPFPINDYGITKIASTLYTYKEAVRNNLPLITFRLFSVYGPFEEKTRLVPSVILSAINHKPINVASPKYVRDFIYIDDVVDAYLQACRIKVIPGEIFNIGTGKQSTIDDIVQIIISLSKSKSEILWETVEKQNRQVEPGNWCADIRKSKIALRWQARYYLKTGMEKTIAWFKKNRIVYE